MPDVARGMREFGGEGIGARQVQGDIQVWKQRPLRALVPELFPHPLSNKDFGLSVTHRSENALST